MDTTKTVERVSSKVKAQGRTAKACLSLDKASAEFRWMVEWLKACSPEQRLAAIVVSELLCSETDFKEEGMYEGRVGNDVLNDWGEEIAEFADDPRHFKNPQDRQVAAYVAKLSAIASGERRVP